MMKWIKTNFPGVRFKEHPIRKYGIKRDQYFTIRYKLDKKDREEGLGWASEGWTAAKAYDRAKELKENRKTGKGAQTLAEKREVLQQEKEIERLQIEQENETIAAYFDRKYFPWALDNKKPNTIKSERILFNKWIRPAIGDIPLLNLSQIDVERFKKFMNDKGRAPKSVHLTLALLRQIYNHAKRPDVYLLAKVRMPKVDNAKLRYLMPEEITTLLSALKIKSQTVYEQAFLAINTGLRFSEVAGLRWGDVNWDTGTLAILDGKTGSRTVFFNKAVAEMLKAKKNQEKTALVFPDKKGRKQTLISRTFQRVADELFNKDVNDRRLKVTFHTLRHSFGTHVYLNTGDLYLTQKSLGHKTLVMAQRYAKMSDQKLSKAFTIMSDILKAEEDKIAKFPKQRKYSE